MTQPTASKHWRKCESTSCTVKFDINLVDSTVQANKQAKPLRTCIQISKQAVGKDVHSKAWSCKWKWTDS